MKPESAMKKLAERRVMTRQEIGVGREEDAFYIAQSFAKGINLSLLNAYELTVQIEREFPGQADSLLREMDSAVMLLGVEPTLTLYLEALMWVIMKHRARNN